MQEKKERKKIALSCHVDVTSGHMGLKKTLARITERFAWKGMTEDVKRIVSPYKHSILIYSYLCRSPHVISASVSIQS